MNSNLNEPDAARPQPAERNPEVTYEAADLSARAVVLFLLFLAAGAVLVTGGLWELYKHMAGNSFLPHPLETPIVSQAEARKIISRFPPPRLQSDPVQDLNTMRAQEELTLNSYGWTGQANGRIHIPIERAMDLLAASGLPVRENAVTKAPQTQTNAEKSK
jgi:hypothetical protein